MKWTMRFGFNLRERVRRWLGVDSDEITRHNELAKLMEQDERIDDAFRDIKSCIIEISKLRTMTPSMANSVTGQLMEMGDRLNRMEARMDVIEGEVESTRRAVNRQGKKIGKARRR